MGKGNNSSGRNQRVHLTILLSLHCRKTEGLEVLTTLDLSLLCGRVRMANELGLDRKLYT